MSTNKGERFEGELKKINPKRLSNEDTMDLDNFFLVLALIFNDLKGLISLNRAFGKYYEPSTENEVSVHAGNYVGQLLHLHRLLVGCIHEFLNFLEENQNVFNAYEFQLVLKKVPNVPRTRWLEIVNIALGSNTSPNATKFAKILLKVRNNSAYHYAKSTKTLRRGFTSFFFEDQQTTASDFAYYSLGDSMGTTRFYYADAALRNYLFSEAKDELSDTHDALSDFNSHVEDVKEMIDSMNMAIHQLMKQYIKSRPHRD